MAVSSVRRGVLAAKVWEKIDTFAIDYGWREETGHCDANIGGCVYKECRVSGQ